MGEHQKLTPSEWEPFFRNANIRVDELDACKSARSRAIKIGNFFSSKVGSEVAIQVKGRTGKAVLRVEQGRANLNRYYFEITWDDAANAVRDVKPPTIKENNVGKPTHNKMGAKVKNAATPAAKKVAAAKAKPAKAKPAKAKPGGNCEDW